MYTNSTLLKRCSALAALLLCGVAAGVPAFMLRVQRSADAGDPIALSPTGRWLAVVERRPPYNRGCYLGVHDTTTGRVVAVFRGGVTMLVAWHPSRPLIAAPCDLGMSGTVLRLLDVRRNTVRGFNPDGGGGDEPVAWLPDGIRVLMDTGGYIGRKAGEGGRVPGLWSRWEPAHAVAVAPDWTVAAERGGNPWGTTFIELYRKQPGRLAYKLVAKLVPDRDPKTGQVTSFRTQPGFMAGRLGYARVFLDARGRRTAVELWTCRKDGKDERKWLSLPLIPKETPYPPGTVERDPGVYRLAPVSWTRDGRMIAYVYKRAVHVKRVKPPDLPSWQPFHSTWIKGAGGRDTRIFDQAPSWTDWFALDSWACVVFRIGNGFTSLGISGTNTEGLGWAVEMSGPYKRKNGTALPGTAKMKRVHSIAQKGPWPGPYWDTNSHFIDSEVSGMRLGSDPLAPYWPEGDAEITDRPGPPVVTWHPLTRYSFEDQISIDLGAQ